MTEDEARQVLLLQAVETTAAHAAPGPRAADGHWSAEDRAWATKQAVATVGEDATPERFVVARAVIALQRLRSRDAGAQRWLARRGWHPAWVLLALVLGCAAGLAADQLGLPQRVNMLAPAVWAVVAWNLVVYAALLLPLPTLGLRAWLAGLGLRSPEGERTAAAGALWVQHAAPLMTERAALVLHTAAAALGAGLVAGLYLRGLVLDYRAGWQSTFLDAPTVQQLLGVLLAPARWLTGIAVPDVAPLRLGPGADAQASAAPWIHLYAATLTVAVLLPRSLLALRAGWRAQRQARRFPLPLDTPYFEALHPLMRPGQPRVLRLAWLCAVPQAVLFGVALGPAAPGGVGAPVHLLRSDEGDELQLLPVPADLAPDLAPAAPPWWAPWRAGASDPLPGLREQVAAVLLATVPGAPRAAWLARLGRPVVVLEDGPTAPLPAGSTAPPSAPLGLQALADGWLAEGRLLQALGAVMDGDPRWQRLAATWTAQQAARFDALVSELAATLARVACARVAVADEGALGARRADADAAREQLVQGLDVELLAHGQRLATLLGLAATSADAGHATALRETSDAAGAALRSRVGEGRAAVVGAMISGALSGLGADLLSGGLTLGAGAVAGGLLGALGAAGAARSLNLVRGTDRSFVAWDEAALAPVTEALLLRALVLAHGLAPEAAAQRLAPALAAQQGSLNALWRARRKRHDNTGEAEALAPGLQRPLADALVQALGGPGRA